MPSRFASSAWAVSAGEVLQDELAAAAACFFRCLLLLCSMLQVVLLLHEGTHTLQITYPSVSPARDNAVSNGQEVWSRPLSGQAWPLQSVRRVVGQQNAAVESHITHKWLYHNMLPKYDQVTHIYANLLRLWD